MTDGRKIPLGYKLKFSEGYWKVREEQGTWKLVKRIETSKRYAKTEVPFPSEEALREFLKEHAEYYAYLTEEDNFEHVHKEPVSQSGLKLE